jgi:hypothetical protein
MDELVLPPNCKYDLKRGVWICGGVELVIGPAEDDYYEEEEEYFEDCGSDLIPAELCTEDYYEEEDEEYEEDD